MSENEIIEDIKRTKKRVTIVFISVILSILILLSYGMIKLISIPDYTRGEIISESSSPNEKYSIKIYFCEGGDFTPWGVRGELVSNNEDYEPKDIYWEFNLQGAHVEWIDNETVKINDLKISVPYGE